jgi:hypothetical protein
MSGKRYRGKRLSVGAAIVVLTAASAVALTPPASAAAGAQIDLAVSSDQQLLIPGSPAVQHLRVTNNGETTTGGVVVTFVTPAYTNIDRGQPLPPGCSIRYTMPDPTIPEVVTCTLPPGLAHGAVENLAMPLLPTTRARLVGAALDITSALPADKSPDQDVNLNDNVDLATPTFTQPTPATPEGNRINLYLSHDVPVVAADHRASATLTYGNTGPNPMQGQTQITVVTPFTTNIDRDKPLATGCRIVLQDPSATVPEIVVCTLAPLAVGEQRSLVIPLKAVPTNLTGRPMSTLLVAPVSPADVEVDQADNLDTFGVKLVRR